MRYKQIQNIKVGGETIATSTATTTLGQPQSYSMEFSAPTRVIGSAVDSEVKDTINRDIITGNTDATAFDTGSVVPLELRPSQDASSTSYVENKLLYKTAQSYLYNLEANQHELANIVGSDFVDAATRATVFNGIEITYDSGVPYSFEWIGLRIDSSVKVSYFYRFSNDIALYGKEFSAIFGLQASQDESDIFEDNFDVESVATVKGLKMVANGEFQGITLHKITSANENDIDSLSISTTSKAIFHDAVDDGKIIYTPSSPVTYDGWEGLFYIAIDFDEATAGYIIGEGLNGGYTIELWGTGWENFWRSNTLLLTATINSPTNNQEFTYGDPIPWNVQYSSSLFSIGWYEIATISVSWQGLFPLPLTLRSGYGTNESVDISINKATLGESGNQNKIDQDIIDAVAANDLPPEFASIMKLIINKESAFENRSIRYEPCKDKEIAYEWIEVESQVFDYRVNTFPFSAWRLPGDMSTSSDLENGTQVDSLKIKHGYNPQEMIKNFSSGAGKSWEMQVNDRDTIYEVWLANDAAHGYTTRSYCDSNDITSSNANFPAQLLIASSYGLGQILYAYHWSKFDPDPNPPARDIWEMFTRKANIQISTAIFKEIYDGNSAYEGTGCEPWDRLWRTIAEYNGNINLSGPQERANQVCGEYIMGNYQLIEQ